MPYRYNDLRVYDRGEWRAPTRLSRADKQVLKVADNPILFVHYSASDGQRVDTLEEQIAVLHNIYNYHVNTRGWLDIGYNWILFQPFGHQAAARIFQGRGPNRIPAAQEGHNEGNLAVCVVADSNDPIKDSTISRLRSLYRRTPCTRLKGHRDVNDTDCPGDRLYARLGEIRSAK